MANFNIGTHRAPQPSQGDEEEDTVSKFSYLYKAKGSGESLANVRRREMLEKQKQKRTDYMRHMRKLTESIEQDIETEQTGADMEVDADEKGKKKKAVDWRYRNQLMISEWMQEKPENFEEEWMMIPVPLGKRNLVVSAQGYTSCYSKTGILVERFPSHLPGGNKLKNKWNIESCILDCIFNDITKTFYILDIMSWKMHPMYDAETEFRFYWLHEKFLEVPEVAKVGRGNPYRFEPLPNFRCDSENIQNVLGCEMNVPLDGLLFYHKKTYYTFGSTPLVLWLRPFMIPEVLGIMVPLKFIERAPPDYMGYKKHLEKVNAEQERKRAMMAEKRHEKERKRQERKGLISPGAAGAVAATGDAAATTSDAAGSSTPGTGAQGKMNIGKINLNVPLSFSFVSTGTLESQKMDT